MSNWTNKLMGDEMEVQKYDMQIQVHTDMLVYFGIL